MPADSKVVHLVPSFLAGERRENRKAGEERGKGAPAVKNSGR